MKLFEQKGFEFDLEELEKKLNLNGIFDIHVIYYDKDDNEVLDFDRESTHKIALRIVCQRIESVEEKESKNMVKNANHKIQQ